MRKREEEMEEEKRNEGGILISSAFASDVYIRCIVLLHFTKPVAFALGNI